MKNFSPKILVLVMSLFLGVASWSMTAEPMPKKFVGTWQVAGVLVDLGTPRTLTYQADDQRLLKKFISISTSGISTNLPEKQTCKNPSMTATDKLTAQELVQSLMPAHPEDSESKFALASDYKFSSDSKKLELSWIACSDGKFGPHYKKHKSTWLTFMNESTLAAGWYDDTILILKLSKEKITQ